jgi:hypothetical protein
VSRLLAYKEEKIKKFLHKMCGNSQSSYLKCGKGGQKHGKKRDRPTEKMEGKPTAQTPDSGRCQTGGQNVADKRICKTMLPTISLHQL